MSLVEYQTTAGDALELLYPGKKTAKVCIFPTAIYIYIKLLYTSIYKRFLENTECSIRKRRADYIIIIFQRIYNIVTKSFTHNGDL